MAVISLVFALSLPASEPATSLFKQHCVECHGPNKQKGKLRLDTLKTDFDDPETADRWLGVLEKLTLGEMPPEDATQPKADELQSATQWLIGKLTPSGRAADLQFKLAHPEYGNHVSHERLFDGSITGPGASPPRLWRISPMAYDTFVESFGNNFRHLGSVSQPFTLEDNKGIFADYAANLHADEATLQRLLLNAEMMAQYQTVGLVKLERDRLNKNQRVARTHKKVPDSFEPLLAAATTPTADQVRAAIDEEFMLILGRPPSDDEQERFARLYQTAAKQGGQTNALQLVITAILLRPESFYRMEIGLGPEDEHGRRRLSPQELSHAIAYALTDKPPGKLMLGPPARNRLLGPPSVEDLAREGKLSTSGDAAQLTRRLLDHNGIDKPRLLRFFHEFFGYHHAPTVFKGDRVGREFSARHMVEDADQLVRHILKEDRQVLKQLLTTDRYFLFYKDRQSYGRVIKRMLGRKKTHEENYVLTTRREGRTPIPEANPAWRKVVRFYNFDETTWSYPMQQPFAMPPGHRAGILTHPAWLVAWSGNFDNDIVRRGKWIREHLLAGHVPDVPITVNAAVPDDANKTLRTRMQVTRQAECWKCHQYMDPLGLAFEIYDDFGRWRQQETTRDKRKHPAIGRGEIIRSGSDELDGVVSNAVDLAHRLADSDRVRQSFVRHAFRYFMGRNETLSDSPTLMAADRAYVDNEGSFKALVVSLLSSDAFLYRK